MTDEESFQRSLDADPLYWQLRVMFADYLQDRDDARAGGYRVLGWLRLVPEVFPTKSHRKNSPEHYAKMTARHSWAGLISGTPYASHLTEAWVVAIARADRSVGIDYGSVMPIPVVTFATRREAEDAAARGFRKLHPARRAKLMISAERRSV